MNWQDEHINRSLRQRTAALDPPNHLSLLVKEDRDLLARWVRQDHASRTRAALLKEAGPADIERADALSDWLLQQGWITRKEKFVGGQWRWEGVIWRDLDRLKTLLGVGSRSQRDEEKAQNLRRAKDWFDSLPQDLRSDFRDALSQVLEQLRAENAMRVDVLAMRLDLLVALVAWVQEQRSGTRRDFALFAGQHTKSIGSGDWKWLECGFDLESLGVSHFVPLLWLAGDAQLVWDDRVIDLAAVRYVVLPLEDALRVTAVQTSPHRWWLIENRASFERQCLQRPRGVLMAWLPGQPSQDWLQAAENLLRRAPAPLWVSADADPAGIDIALTVGALWASQAQAWEPHCMGVEQWQTAKQQWPLNQYDMCLLERLLGRAELPGSLRELCQAMVQAGIKAEQEGWL